MARALRYARRAATAIALLLAMLFVAVLIFTRTATFNRMVRDQLASFLATNYRGQIRLERIAGSIWGNLTIYGISINYQGTEILSAPRVSLSYSLLPLVWHAVRVQVVAFNPALHLSRGSNGKWNLLEALASRHPKAAGRSKFAVYLDSTGIRGGSLEVAPSGPGHPRYRFDHLALDANLTILPGGIEASLRRFDTVINAPGLPPLNTDAALDYDAVRAPPTLRVAHVRVSTADSAATLSGVMRRLQTMNFDTTLTIEKLAAADIARVYKAARLRADMTGKITLQGPENALHMTVALAVANATLNGSADADVTQKAPPYAIKATLARADLQKIVALGGVAGMLDANLQAQGRGTRLDAIKAQAQVSGHKLAAAKYSLERADLTARIDSQKLTLTGVGIGGVGELKLDGIGELAKDPDYRLTVTSRQLDLANAGTATKTHTDLNLRAIVDGRGVKTATMDTRIAVTAARSRVGSVAISNAIADVRINRGRALLNRARCEAERSTLELRGSAGLAAGAPMRISYALRAPTLAPWLELARTNGDGKLAIDGLVSGPPSALATNGQIALDSLSVSSSRVHRGVIHYALTATGQGAPYGSIGANLTGVSARADLRSLDAVVQIGRGMPHAGTLMVKAIDDGGRGQKLAADFRYQPQLVDGHLTELIVAVPGGTWRLAKAARFSKTPQQLAIDQLLIVNGRRQLTLDGHLGEVGPQNLRLAVSQLDLSAFDLLARHGRKFSGAVSAEMRINGTASAPTINAMMNANRVLVNDQRVGEVSAALDYRSGRAAIDASMRQNMSDSLKAHGTLPVAVEWTQGFKAKLKGDADLKITSPRLDLSPLAALAPGKLRDFAGLAAIDLNLRGPVTRPIAQGSIRLAGIKGEVVPLGVKIAEMHARIEVDPQTLRLVTLAAQSGDGTMSGGGAISLHDYAPTAMRLNVNFDRWPAIATPDYEATIGGNLTAQGSLDAPQVLGKIEVLQGTIRPDLAFLSTTAPLAPDETITVVRPGQHDEVPTGANPPPAPAAPPPPPRAQSASFNKLAMDVMVLIHRNTWIRHPDAAADLEGHLHVVKKPEHPVTVAGEIDTVRGWLSYQNKRFTLETGRVLFTGAPHLDPLLDIDARYTLPNYTVDVVVGGTSKKPTLQLKSQPELAQADILSLLLFGRTTSTLNQGQQASLQQNAARMATGFAASQVSQAVSNSLGLESMGVELSNVSGSGGQVGFGRYIGENTYVSASQTVGATQNQQDQGQKISIQYFITRWLSVTTSNASRGGREIGLSITKQY